MEASSPYPRRVEFPEIPLSTGPGASKINAYFEDRLETEYACHPEGGSEAKELSYRHTAKVTFLRGHLLGVTTEYDWYCGGPHPDSGTSAVFFDLRSGAVVDLNNFVEGQRKRAFVESYLKRAAGDVDAECAALFTPTSLENTRFEFLPNEEGARAFPLLPYTMRACASPSTFSWSELGTLMDLAQFE